MPAVGGTPALRAALPVLLALIATHSWVNFRQPAAYMDELFHVPQASAFCLSLRSHTLPPYSAKLTTPPGPYIISALLSPLFGCSIRALRLHSAVAVALTLPPLASVAHILLGRDRSSLFADAAAWRVAVALVSHPPLLFSGGLFYTDAFATLFLALCWSLALRDAPVLSALSGIVAAATRQTSAVWHALFALHGLTRMLRRDARLPRVLRALTPHLLAGMLYVTLFVWNGFSVPLGDREHHSMHAHWAMLPYFLVYRALFALPLLLSATLSMLHLILLSPSATLAIVAATVAALAACVLASGAYVHPFALADNRHYVFYVYRRVLLRSARVRLALVVPYVAAFLLPLAPSVESFAIAARAREKSVALRRPRDLRAWLVMWAARDGVAELAMQGAALVVTAVCVIPAQLLEPRYFIQGYIVTVMLFLTCKRAHFGRCQMALCVAFNIAVHFVIVYVFAELPFSRPLDPHMPHDLSPGRFMY